MAGASLFLPFLPMLPIQPSFFTSNLSFPFRTSGCSGMVLKTAANTDPSLGATL